MFFDQARQSLILAREVTKSKVDKPSSGPEITHVSPSKTPTRRKGSNSAVVFAFLAICLIWGSTYLAIRYGVETIPPLLMMGIRHLAAGGMLYAWARWRGIAAPSLLQWRSAAVTGAFLFLGSHGSLAWAEQRVPSGLAALLSATLPLWIVLLTRITGRDRHLRMSVIAGLLLGFVGVGILIGPSAFHGGSSLALLPAVAVLFGTVCWATGTIYAQRVTLPSSALLSSAMQMLSGGAALMLVGVAAGETSRMHVSAMSMKSALSLGYLIVFGSVIAFSAFTWLHKHVSATRNSTYAYVNPVVAVFLGWALAGEAIGARTVLATVTILASVALVSYKGAESKDASREPASSRQKTMSFGIRQRELSAGD
jgi:drug/metabolite transporter (DMT)-like permease